MSKIGSTGAGNIAGIGAVNLDFQTADIELLLASVQLKRADLIENELRTMVETIKNRNEAMEKLGGVKSDLTTQKTYFDGKTDGSSLIDQKHYDPSGWNKKQLQDAYAANPEAALARALNGEFGPQGKELATLAQSMRTAGISDETVFKVASGKITAPELDAAMTAVTAKSDSLSATQNIDMIKLQAMQSRRTEAFEVVTNTIKKTGESRSGIISNMR